MVRISLSKRSKTEQKRASPLPRLEFEPIDLPADFPVVGGNVFCQTDRPITCLHVHNCLELGYCHSGSGIFMIEDKVLTYKAGDVSVINDRELHLAQSTRGTVSEWSFIMLDPLRLLGAQVDDPGILATATFSGQAFKNILSAASHPEIASLVKEFVLELAERRTGYRSVIRGLVWALMVRLQRLPEKGGAQARTSSRDDMQRLLPALQYMVTHYRDPLAVPELARRCSLSPSHFRRLFIRAVGKSPLAHLTSLRVHMAAALLENTRQSILDIALTTGYPTLSSFNRNFRRLMGGTPRDWRKKKTSTDAE